MKGPFSPYHLKSLSGASLFTSFLMAFFSNVPPLSGHRGTPHRNGYRNLDNGSAFPADLMLLPCSHHETARHGPVVPAKPKPMQRRHCHGFKPDERKGCSLDKQKLTGKKWCRRLLQRDDDAMTRVRVILTNGIESEAVRFPRLLPHGQKLAPRPRRYWPHRTAPADHGPRMLCTFVQSIAAL